ncbi:MAG: hypothetical protein ACLQVM_14470 [Terriglobia bacterium]
MTFEKLNSELKTLIGQSVSFKRVAANSVIIYFFGGPGDSTVLSVFIDPPWRYEREGKLILGSYDVSMDKSEFDSEEQSSQAFYHLASYMDDLVGASLLKCQVDPMSSDIAMEFSGGRVLRSFANSAFEDTAWTYRNYPKNFYAQVSSPGITVGELSTEP